MVLYVDDAPLTSPLSSLDDLYRQHPSLLTSARSLACEKPHQFASPSAVERVLYVRQKAHVVCHQGERLADGLTRVRTCATGDVLTCHVIVLHHAVTRVTALAHFDEYVKSEQFQKMLDEFQERVRARYFFSEDDGDSLEDEGDDWEWEEWRDGEEEMQLDLASEPIELHLVGGYADEAGKAGRLSRRVLQFFHAHPSAHFHLKTCCLGRPNSRQGRNGHNVPIVGGVAVDVADGRPRPANFDRNLLAGKPEVDEEIQWTLMLGPSLIRKPFKLKRMIEEKEDSGYGSRSAA